MFYIFKIFLSFLYLHFLRVIIFSSLCFSFLQQFENKIKQWCHEAGEDVSYEFLQVSTVICAWCTSTVSFKILEIGVVFVTFWLVLLVVFLLEIPFRCFCFLCSQRSGNAVLTSTADDDPWWSAFSSACNKM